MSNGKIELRLVHELPCGCQIEAGTGREVRACGWVVDMDAEMTQYEEVGEVDTANIYFDEIAKHIDEGMKNVVSR